MNQSKQIKYDQIAVVGEYTVPSGPGFEDHYLVIVYRSGGWIAIPVQDALSIIPQLETAIGTKIQWGLANITDAFSRIIYPSELAGHALLNFGRSKPGIRNLFKLITSFGVNEAYSRLTDEVSEYVVRLEYSESVHKPRHSPPNPPEG